MPIVVSKRETATTTVPIQRHTSLNTVNLTGNGSSLPRHRGGPPSTARDPPEEVPEENGGGANTTEDIPSCPITPNTNNQHPNNRVRTISRNTNANITVATLNMKGRATTSLGTSQISKWQEIYNLMKTKRIGILALQETHLKDEHVNMIHELYGKWIKVLNSSLTGNTGGVAFVLNREIANTENTEMTTIIPG